MSRMKLSALALFTVSLAACSSEATQGDGGASIEVDPAMGATSTESHGSRSGWRDNLRRRLRDAGSGATQDAASTPDASAPTPPAPTSPTPTSPAPTPTSPAPTTPTPTPPAPAPTIPTPPSPSPSPSSGSPRLAGCDLYPADNAWNRDVSADALHSNSTTYIANMAPSGGLHADWGTTSEQYGIPINAGPAGAPVPMSWSTSWGASESDKISCPNGGGTCYPIPSSCKIEGGPSADSGADRHILFLDTTGAPKNCTLYETYMTQNWSGGGWTAGNGAVFRLGSNALRPDGWTSGDAAGLPILPGLVRYDEIAAGEIKHAIRFTLKSTQQAYIHPATHAAGKANAALPPMGLRVRLKAGVSVANASPAAQVLIKAMKTYGLILADNGSNWYVTGDTNDGWSAVTGGIQSAIGRIHGSDFEVVSSGTLSTNGL